MMQGELFGAAVRKAPPARKPSPRAVGLSAAGRAMQAAIDMHAFDADGARRFIVGWVRRHGPASGEELVKQAKLHGFCGKDDRCFGGVFLAAQRAGELVCLRSDLPRARGHGTSGGRLWGAE